jgi:3-deoxy-D-manno-octulosonic-acid transferase
VISNLSLWLYGVFMRLAQPLLRRKLHKRAQAEPLYGQFIEERFGYYTQSARQDWIWIHAVSLGETRTAAILLESLRQAIPGMKLLLTNGTATGREEGRKLLQEGDVQVWQPWDSNPKWVCCLRQKCGLCWFSVRKFTAFP